MARVYFRRLTKGDFEGLAIAHRQLAETIGLLHQTNWAAAPACIVLLGNVDRLICDLYNKTESSLKAALGLPIADPPVDTSSAAEPAVNADQEPKPGGQD